MTKRFLWWMMAIALAGCTSAEGPEVEKPAADTTAVTNKPLPPAGTPEIPATETRPPSVAELETDHRLRPDDKEVAYNLGYEYAIIKNSKALPLADTLLRRDRTETRARAWYIKATYYNTIEKPAEALRCFDSANIADYQFLDAYFDKGQLLFSQKKYEAALKSFALGQKVAPATADFYFWVARCQQALGDNASAKGNYETAYALDKNMVEAKEAAAKLGGEK